MTKPWEEEWTGAGGHLITPGGAVHLDPGPRARLAAAAPDMARLLLEAEWASGASWGPSGDDAETKGMACFFCDGFEAPILCRDGKPSSSGHAPDCRLVAVLRKAGVR